jgi:hypothetical protein
VVASNLATFCWASASPAGAVLLADGELLELAPVLALVFAVLLELLLELQAASTATAVIATLGASQRFHLCVIACDASIPPITTGP